MRTVVSLGRGGGTARRAFAFPRIPGRGVEAAAAGLDAVLIVLIVTLGCDAAAPASYSVADLAIAPGLGLIASALHLTASGGCGLYRLRALSAPRPLSGRTLVVSTFTGIVLALLFAVAPPPDGPGVSGLAVPAMVALALVLLRLVEGFAVWRLLARRAIVGRPVIGIASPRNDGCVSADALLVDFGEHEVAHVRLGPPEEDAARLREAIDLARQHGACAFNLAVDLSDLSRLNGWRETLRLSPLPAYLLPVDATPSASDLGEPSGAPHRTRILLQRAPLAWPARATKRAFDVVVATLALFVLSPLLVMVALAIKMDTRGPVIFPQRRKGFDQQPFVIFKFRTMCVQEDGPTIRQASRNDDRVTRVGRYLRRSSIDEIPQLLNVIGGSMSLVGPRPHAIAHDDHYGRMIDNYHLRHHVKPGITGWAQVNGIRGATAQLADMQARVDHDLWYVNHWSPLLDLVILARTCVTVLRHDAY